MTEEKSVKLHVRWHICQLCDIFVDSTQAALICTGGLDSNDKTSIAAGMTFSVALDNVQRFLDGANLCADVKVEQLSCYT